MYGDGSIGSGFFWALRALSDIAFRWIPGTVEVVTGQAPQGDSSIVYHPITQPVTPSDISHFLQSAAAHDAYSTLYHDWIVWIVIAVIVSLLCAALIIYCVIRILQVRTNELERFRAAGETVAAKDVSKTQLRWHSVLERAQSDDEKNWRLAILEADIMLNELLDVLGYRGETMADKMKQVKREGFKTIDLAWEAHRVRNQIAHQGSIMQLSSHETRRVITMYGQVFREFKFIQ
jgi:hypothetical protein